MIEIKTETSINAPANVVWQCLTDFEKYPQWNPFIVSIVGDLYVGNTLEVKINPPSGKRMEFTPEIITCDSDRELRWAGVMLSDWVFRGEHYFKLEKINEQQTRLIHGEYFSGVLSKLIMLFLKDKTQAGFELMNAELKKRANLS